MKPGSWASYQSAAELPDNETDEEAAYQLARQMPGIQGGSMTEQIVIRVRKMGVGVLLEMQIEGHEDEQSDPQAWAQLHAGSFPQIKTAVSKLLTARFQKEVSV